MHDTPRHRQGSLDGKYLTAEPANWEEGDWNGDGLFDQDDIVAGPFDRAAFRMPHDEDQLGTGGGTGKLQAAEDIVVDKVSRHPCIKNVADALVERKPWRQPLLLLAGLGVASCASTKSGTSLPR